MGGQWEVMGGQWEVMGGQQEVMGGQWEIMGGQWEVMIMLDHYISQATLCHDSLNPVNDRCACEFVIDLPQFSFTRYICH